MKRKNRNKFQKVSWMLVLCLIFSCAAGIFSGNRAEAASERAAGISESSWAALRRMFPNGKYWNHVTVSLEEYTANKEKYNSTYSDYACDDRSGVSLPSRHDHGGCGTCGCNSYDGATQCMGFASYVGHYLSGRSVRSWDMVATSLDANWLKNNLQSGDYIRFGTNENGHSAIVVSVSASGASLVECNFVKKNTGENCKISWTREISFAKLAVRKSTKGTGYVQRSGASVKIVSDIPSVYVNQAAGFAYEVSSDVQKTDVKWKSSNPDVLVAAAGGGIRGKKAGKATVTAYLEDKTGKVICEDSKEVTVTDCKVSFSKTAVTLEQGKTTTLTPVTEGIDSSYTKSFKSSNTEVAAVSSSGVVTGKGNGTATITVNYKGSPYGTYSATCKVTVNSSLKMNKTSAGIYKDCTVQLEAEKKGVSGTIKWKSANPSIASVSSKGLVKGKKAGTVVITATCAGKSATCKVTVKNPTIRLSRTSTGTAIGETVGLLATVKGKSSKVTWKSSNSSIASVSKTGIVTGKKEGTVTITAKANGVSATCKVVVRKYDMAMVLAAYRSKLRSYNTSYKFCLIYLDNDTIPELVVMFGMDSMHMVIGEVYQYTKSGIRELSGAGSDFSRVIYSPKKGVAFSSRFINGYGEMDYLYQYTNGKQKKLKSFVSAGSVLKVDGRKVSKSAYNTALKKMKAKYPLKYIQPSMMKAVNFSNLDLLTQNYQKFVVTGKPF